VLSIETAGVIKELAGRIGQLSIAGCFDGEGFGDIVAPLAAIVTDLAPFKSADDSSNSNSSAAETLPDVARALCSVVSSGLANRTCVCASLASFPAL
jgi:hypothetical protein